jgi:hypothetical protein
MVLYEYTAVKRRADLIPGALAYREMPPTNVEEP